ncbi:MAG: hypothetical protein ACERKD_19125 [Prolixibacteraceae bacterium]
MKNLSKLSIIIFFIFNSIFSFAQFNYMPGYIIDLKNDTIHGYIASSGEIRNSKKCKFRLTRFGKTQRYSPTDLKEYRINKYKKYKSKELPINKRNKQVFVDVLLDGTISLYHNYKPKNREFFLENEDGQIIPLINKENKITVNQDAAVDNRGLHAYQFSLTDKLYQDSLLSYLSECKKVSNYIYNVHYNEKSLLNFTKEYLIQTSSNASPILYEKNLDITKLRIGVFTGLRSSEILFEKYNQTASKISQPVGIYFKVPFDLWSNRLFFQVEMIGNSVHYNSSYTEEFGVLPFDLRISTLEIPVMLKYEINNWRLVPGIAIGKSINTVVHSNTNLVHPVQNTKPFIDFTCAYKISDNLSLFSSLRFNAYTGLILKNKDNKQMRYKYVVENQVYQKAFTAKSLSINLGLQF